jgi:2-polyprenyl-3-methyl-5-hydroxy-6-metoxy-1,4-benzoquinol methylase
MIKNNKIDHIDNVEEFFNKTQRHLKKNFHIYIRKIIIRSLIGEISKGTILDIGCGDGSLSIQFLSKVDHITFLDVSNPMLEIVRKNLTYDELQKVSFINIDFNKWVTNKKYDLILCIGLFAYIRSIKETLNKISSMMQPNGICIIQITDIDKIIGRAQYIAAITRQIIRHQLSFKITPLSSKKIINTAKENDLILCDQRRYSILFPGMGWLPEKQLFKLEYFSFINRKISKFGAENFLLFKKIETRKNY